MTPRHSEAGVSAWRLGHFLDSRDQIVGILVALGAPFENALAERGEFEAEQLLKTAAHFRGHLGVFGRDYLPDMVEVPRRRGQLSQDAEGNPGDCAPVDVIEASHSTHKPT